MTRPPIYISFSSHWIIFYLFLFAFNHINNQKQQILCKKRSIKKEPSIWQFTVHKMNGLRWLQLRIQLKKSQLRIYWSVLILYFVTKNIVRIQNHFINHLTLWNLSVLLLSILFNLGIGERLICNLQSYLEILL